MKKYAILFLVALSAVFIFASQLLPRVAHASTSPRLYVSNSDGNNVSVIDPATSQTITTIPVGATPRTVVAHGNHVYVANVGGHSVSVIDTTTNSVTATIPVGTAPERIALNPDGSRLYVGDMDTSTNTVVVIDTATNTILTRLTSGFSIPQGLAINPAGTRLYVANNNCCSGAPGYVSVLDTSNYSTIATIQVGLEPTHIAFTPDGTKAYVTNNGGQSLGGTVSVIDTGTNTVTNTITTGTTPGTGPYVVAVNSTGTRAYVLNTYYWAGTNGKVSVIDTSTDSIVATVPVGYTPEFVALSLDDSKLYVPNAASNTLSVIDAATNTVVGSIPVGNFPFGVVEVSTNTNTNTAPSVGTITASPNPVTVNTTVTSSANFTDANTSDTHTATADWGDGSNPQPCTVTESNGSGVVSCTYQYATANVYPMTITVSDGTLSGSSPVEYISVYNPTQQSIFTAGQRFTSPAGAYPQNSSLTGNVMFGLSYKYQGTVPTGNRQFSMDFNAATFHFNATMVDSLVISNGMGTLRGTGTVNGSGTYTFLVTGSESANTIRIQIKDSLGSVKYDTQPGASDTATPSTLVTGNVLAH
jgi:YVTN family beta-propeller protein